MRKPSRAELTAIVVAAIFFGCLLVGNRIIWGQDGIARHQQLTREFSSLQPFPGSVRVEKTDLFNPWWSHKVVVGASYTASAQYLDIRGYYDQELTARGWRFVEERPYRVWGEDLGGRLRDYCKGPLEAELEYAGSQAGRTYSLALSWGLSHKCDSGS